MGLNREQFVILASLAKAGVLADKACLTLGRQNNFLRHSDLKAIAKAVGIELDDGSAKEFLNARFIEPILYKFGAKSADSIDACTYEGASIAGDLNVPIPDDLRGKFEFVYDGGTLEHIYNYPQALRNVSYLLSSGGILFSTSPANNEPGHGFYQFSSELIFSAFPKNDLEILAAFLVATQSPAQFYALLPPPAGERITFLSGEPVQLFVIARKVSRTLGDSSVLQSDYVAGKWKSGADHATWDRSLKAKLKRLFHRIVVLRLIWPVNFLLRSLYFPCPAVWATSSGIRRISIRDAAARACALGVEVDSPALVPVAQIFDLTDFIRNHGRESGAAVMPAERQVVERTEE